MAERVRRRADRQAKGEAGSRHNFLHDPLVERTTGVVLRRGSEPAPAARTLLDLLSDRLAEPAASAAERWKGLRDTPSDPR